MKEILVRPTQCNVVCWIGGCVVEGVRDDSVGPSFVVGIIDTPSFVGVERRWWIWCLTYAV